MGSQLKLAVPLIPLLESRPCLAAAAVFNVLSSISGTAGSEAENRITTVAIGITSIHRFTGVSLTFGFDLGPEEFWQKNGYFESRPT